MNHVTGLAQLMVSDLLKDVIADALARHLLRGDGMLLVILQTRVVMLMVIMVEILQVTAAMTGVGTTSIASVAQRAGVVAHPHREASMMAALAAPNGSSLTIQFPREASKVWLRNAPFEVPT